MNIQILGAHAGESKTTRCISFLINETLAIDCGAITSSLTLSEQKNISSLLVTHSHFDHIKDIPLLALNFFRMKKTINIYALPDVNSSIVKYLLNGYVYPELYQLPQDKPTVKFHRIIPLREYIIGKYSVTAVPVKHHGNTVGYQVRDFEGKTIFYTSDTGIGISEALKQISCQLLFIETTLPNARGDYARQTAHLTPKLLLNELKLLRKSKGELPRIVVVHIDPFLKKQVEKELRAVSTDLKTPITVAEEGMQFSL